MENKFKHPINYIATIVAITSLAAALFCTLIFKNSSDTGFVGIGYFVSIAVLATNTIMTPLLIINTIRRIKDYQEHIKAIALLLLSIPIALYYLEII